MAILRWEVIYAHIVNITPEETVTEPPLLDAIVVGGGPAGATAARLLALWGHSVTLLTKPEPLQHTLAVSLPPSCRKLFDRLGVLEAVDGAGFQRTRGNTVWWGESEGRSEDFAAGETGYEVVLRDLDRLLLKLAAAGGAVVCRDATVRGVDLGNDDRAGARIEYEAVGGRHEIAARWVLDCSGRAGVIARQDLRKGEEGYDTLALVGVWRCEGRWDVPHQTHTLVESYKDGWAWSVPVSPSLRYVTVMVDPDVTQLARGNQLIPMYRAELAKTVQFHRLLSAATLEEGPWGFGASPHSADRFCGENFLLVGDAASCVDPLSSFGVKKAMASAWLAAVVTHTCITKPPMQKVALEFFDTRERAVYSSYRKLSAQYFREVAKQHDHPFWTGRAAGADELDSVGGGEPDMDSIRRDQEVLAAFAALKASPSISLRPTKQLVTVKKPAIRGNEVVLEDGIATPWGGLRFLRGVDLPKLVGMSAEHSQVPDLFDAYNEASQPVILPDFLGALSVLLAKGMLENRASVA